MADVMIGEHSESIAALEQRTGRIEQAVEGLRNDFTDYKVKERKATCGAPGLIELSEAKQAVKFVELKRLNVMNNIMTLVILLAALVAAFKSLGLF